MKKIFLVDADDTILDFHASSERALKAAFAHFNVLWEDRFLSEFRVINGGLWAALERKELTRTELMERRFPIYLAHMHMNLDGKAFNEFFVTHLANNPIYIDGAERFLENLNALGRVFIVTNGTEYIQKSRFSISRLYEKAENVFISDTIGVDKPAKGYTDYVIAHIKGFDKEDAVWIGDSLTADITAANNAGITSIWYNPSGKPIMAAAPDFVAKDFAGILDILQKN